MPPALPAFGNAKSNNMRGGKRFSCSFDIDAAGAVVAGSALPGDVVPVHVATGKYTLTISRAFPGVQFAQAAFIKNAAARNDRVKVLSVAASAGKTVITIQTQAVAGTDGVLASGKLCFDAELRDR